MTISQEELKRSASPVFMPEEAGDHKRARTEEIDQISYNGRPLVQYGGYGKYKYEMHEAMPLLPSNHPNTTVVLNLIRDVIEHLTNPFEGTSGDDKEIYGDTGILAQLLSKLVIQFGPRMTVLPLGDTGVGKTTYLNSLLSLKRFAHTADSGKSCTQVVQILKENTNESVPYSAVVTFKSEQKALAELQAHYASYYFYNDCDTKLTRKNVADGEPDDKEIYETAAAAAEDYFLAIFCKFDGFSKDKIKDTLMTGATGPDDTRKLKMLRALIYELWKSKGLQNGDRTFQVTAGTPNAFRRKITEFTTICGPDKTSFWPLVEQVDTSLDSAVLRAGINLADAPGLNDRNIERRWRTEKFMGDCGLILVVQSIGRVVDVSSFIENLKTAVRLKGANNVFIILTKIDEIEGNPDGLDNDTASELERLEDQYEEANDFVQELEASLMESDVAEEVAMKAKLNDAKTVRDTCHAKLDRRRIAARNDIVIDDIRGVIGQMRLEKVHEEIEIYPVSSKEYIKYVEGASVSDTAKLDLSGTGFPQIRARLCERAQEGQTKIMARHLKVTIPTLMYRLLLLMQQSKSHRKVTIMDIVKRILQLAVDQVKKYIPLIRGLFTSRVLTVLKRNTVNKKAKWSVKLAAEITSWDQEFHANTFAAFCRKQGIHRPTKLPAAIDLNSRLLKVLADEIHDCVSSVGENLNKIKADVCKHMTENFVLVKDEISIIPQVGEIDLDTLFAQFDLRKRAFEDDINDFFDDLRNQYSSLAEVELTDPTISKAFYDAMHKVWAQCVSLKKGMPQMTQRRLELIAIEITTGKSESPFMALHTALKKESVRMTKSSRSTLENVCSAPFEGSLADLKDMFGGPNMDAKDRKEIDGKLRAVRPLVLSKLKEAVEALDEVKKLDRPEYVSSEPISTSSEDLDEWLNQDEEDDEDDNDEDDDDDDDDNDDEEN